MFLCRNKIFIRILLLSIANVISYYHIQDLWTVTGGKYGIWAVPRKVYVLKFCIYTKNFDKMAHAKSADSDQTAPEGGSALFAILLYRYFKKQFLKCQLQQMTLIFFFFLIYFS